MPRSLVDFYREFCSERYLITGIAQPSALSDFIVLKPPCHIHARQEGR